MKPRCSKQTNHALTLTEVLVTMVAVCLLALVAVAQSADSQAKAQRINCVNNLKQVGLAFRIWAGDNGDKYPAQVPGKLGGAKEAAARGNVAPIFQVMSNELWTPKILVCPADTGRAAAKNFTTGFDNSHVSYFVGVDASNRYPQRLLSGDSNLAVDGVPVRSGLVELPSNAAVTWTSEWHGNQGNLGLADGSVQQANQVGLRKMVQETGLATSRLAVP